MRAPTSVTVVRAREPRDLLALVPYRLGFHPEESVVLLSLVRNPRGRFDIGLVARVDIADLADPRVGPPGARELAAALAEDGADDVAVVAYTAAPFAQAAAEGTALAAALTHMTAALKGVDPAPWVVAADAWGHPRCTSCCSPAGHDLADIARSEVAAAMVLEGYSVVPDRAALALVRTTTGPHAEAVSRGADEERARRRVAVRAAHAGPPARGAAFGLTGGSAGGAALGPTRGSAGGSALGPTGGSARGPGAVARWRRTGADLWDTLADRAPGTPLDPRDLGRLQAFLDDKTVRDAVIARTVAGSRGSSADLLTIADLDFARALGAPPDTAAVDRAMDLAGAVAAPAAAGRAAPALTILAFLAWWSADGARAEVYTRQALSEEPGYRMAVLVRASLEGRVPPPWHRPGAPRRRRPRRG